MDEVCMCKNELDEINDLILNIDDKVKNVAEEIDNFRLKHKNEKFLVFILIVLAFIAFDFWAETVHRFTIQVIHKNQVPSWNKTLLYAIAVTGLFLLIIYFTDLELIEFEKL